MAASSSRFDRFGLLALLLVLGSGCATLPGPETLPPTAASGAFSLAGRIGVRYEDHGFYGNLRWAHSPQRDEVWILSPLGQALAHITGDRGGMTLTTSDQKTYRAEDAESLTREVLGWSLPLKGLQYWIVGRAGPHGAAQMSRDAEGRVVRLAQDGWQIDYLDYTAQGSQVLPRIVAARRDGLEIKLTVDEWLAAPSAP